MNSNLAQLSNYDIIVTNVPRNGNLFPSAINDVLTPYYVEALETDGYIVKTGGSSHNILPGVRLYNLQIYFTNLPSQFLEKKFSLLLVLINDYLQNEGRYMILLKKYIEFFYGLSLNCSQNSNRHKTSEHTKKIEYKRKVALKVLIIGQNYNIVL